MEITTIDCRSPNWVKQVEAVLRLKGEADVANFELSKHGSSCALLAKSFDIEFRHRDSMGHFRKKIAAGTDRTR